MVLRGKTKQEALSEFRSAEILQAAQKVFAQKGFSQTTVEEIAQAAGVAKGTLYLYFPSKREIYLGALRQGIGVLQERTRQKVEAARTAPEKLLAFISSRVKYFEENRDFFKIYHSEFANLVTGSPRLDPNFKDLYGKPVALLESVLQEGIRKREIRAVPAGLTAFAIYQMTREMIVRRVLGWSETSAAEETEFIFDLVWQGIRKR